MKKTVLFAFLVLVTLPLFSQYLVPCERLFGVLCDSTGTVKIKTDYDDISQIHDYKHIARIMKNHKVGIIELLQGKELFPCKYEEIYPCYSIPNTFVLKENGLYVFYDYSTKKNLCPPFDLPESLSIDNGLVYMEKNNWLQCKLNGKWGVMTYDGQTIIPFNYSKLMSRKNGRSENFLACENGKCGVLDSIGKVKSPFKYPDALGFWNSYYVFSNGKKWVFVNSDMKEYDRLPRTEETEYRAMFNSDFKYALISSNGEEITPFKYTEMHVGEKIAVVFKTIEEGRYGLINFKGQELSSFDYDRIEPFHPKDGNLLAFMKYEKHGLMDTTGKEVTEELYDYIIPHAVFIVVEKDGKRGYLNELGKLVLPCIYEEVLFFDEGDMAGVKMNGKWGFIDKTGKTVIPFKYDKTDYFRNGFAKVELNKRVGKIDLQGNETW